MSKRFKKKDHMEEKLPKKLSDFMKDECGDMSRENILKVGIGTLAALGMASSFSSHGWAQVDHTNDSSDHVNFGNIARIESLGDGEYKLTGSTSHIDGNCHSDHYSHSSHSSGK